MITNKHLMLMLLVGITVGSGGAYALTMFSKPVTSYGIVALGDAHYFLSADGTSPIKTLTFFVTSDGSYSASMHVVNLGKPMTAAIAWDNPSWPNSAITDLTLTWDLSGVIGTGVDKIVNIRMTVNKVLDPTSTVREFNYRLIVVGNVAEITGG